MKDSSHEMETLKLNLKMCNFIKESSGYNHIDEPVSPPACDPDQGPPLIFSQSIEDIASEVVDENRKSKKIEKENILQKDNIDFNIPKVVKLAERNPCSSLIPATVLEISEDPKPYELNPLPTLHMSGGMVSTDMPLHMTSVQTSVITPNTSIETRPETDEAIDNIFEYFMCATGDNIRHVREPEMQRNSAIKNHFNTPHEICPNLPLDLSFAKTQKVSKHDRKRQREETTKEQEICIAKRSFTEVMEEELKMEEKNRLQKDWEGVTNEDKSVRKQLLRNVQAVDESAMNIKETTTNKENSAVETSERGNNVACRLILPKRKQEKARIVFDHGMYVEIDREMFKTLEQNIVKEKKLESHKTPQKTSKTVKHVTTAQFRRRKSKKQNSIDQQVKNNAIHVEGDSSGCVENCDITMRDMPMIVTNDNEETQRTSEKDDKPTNKIQINGDSMTPPPTPPPSNSSNILLPISTPLNSILLSPASSPPPSTLNFPTPPPSNPCSPPGLHKLPSIVSKPSYYAKCEGRKVLKAGKC